MYYHTPHISLRISTHRRSRAHLSWGTAAAICLLLCIAAPAAATRVLPAGESFSGKVIGNPILPGNPAELTIILNSSPAITPPKMVRCTGGLVLGQVPAAPGNINFIEVLGAGSRSGSVFADAQTILSVGSCEFTGKIPMSESGNASWSLTWDTPFAGIEGTLGTAPVGLVRIPAGFNLIGQVGKSASCTVIIGPDEAQTMLSEWVNHTSTKPATMRFTNQELVVSASAGCSANVVHTADVSAEYSVSGKNNPIVMGL